MLLIDENCITALLRSEEGHWSAWARFGDTIAECTWEPDTTEERTDEFRHVVRNVVDHLRVSAVRDLIAADQALGLTAGDIVYAVRAADRIGDLDIDGILSHAWRHGLLKTVALVGEEEVAA